MNNQRQDEELEEDGKLKEKENLKLTDREIKLTSYAYPGSLMGVDGFYFGAYLSK